MTGRRTRDDVGRHLRCLIKIIIVPVRVHVRVDLRKFFLGLEKGKLQECHKLCVRKEVHFNLSLDGRFFRP